MDGLESKLPLLGLQTFPVGVEGNSYCSNSSRRACTVIPVDDWAKLQVVTRCRIAAQIICIKNQIGRITTCCHASVWTLNLCVINIVFLWW